MYIAQLRLTRHFGDEGAESTVTLRSSSLKATQYKGNFLNCESYLKTIIKVF